MGYFQHDGQRERAVAAEQYLSHPAAEDLVHERPRSRFLRAYGILEPPVGHPDVLAPPEIGMPGIIDARDQVRRPVGIRPDPAKDKLSGVKDRLVVRRLRAQGVQVTELRTEYPFEQGSEHARRHGVGYDNLSAGDTSFFQQRMMSVRLDNNDAVLVSAGSQAVQQRDRHRIQADENRGILHHACAEAVQWLPP